MILQEPSGELRFTNWNVKTSNGSDLQMRFGMKLTITKGLTWNQYPLDKLQFFNYKPYELLLYTKNDKCQDDPKQNDVTCQWYVFLGNIFIFICAILYKYKKYVFGR